MTAERIRLSIDWLEIEEYCRNVHRQIVEHVPAGQIKTIVAIARGGLVPAAILANMMDIRNVQSLPLSSYFGDLKRQIVADPIPDVMASVFNERTVLFIDDIVDSGDTQHYIENRFPRALFAVLMANPTASRTPFFCGCYRPSDEWVVFPWEVIS